MKNTSLTLLIFIVCTNVGFSQSTHFDALLFTKTDGFRHSSIEKGGKAIQKLGTHHDFSVNWTENTEVFTEERLAEFEVIIFLNTTGDILNQEEQAAMEAFIQSGKGFVGIHSASDTEYDWLWYTKLVGRMFQTHPAVQEAKISVEDDSFPGLKTHPQTRVWNDEWYIYKEETVDDLNYLITVDENSYHAEANGIKMGEFHPVSWFHYFDGGRSFYSGMGHVEEAYEDDLFLQHLYGGIVWAVTGETR